MKSPGNGFWLACMPLLGWGLGVIWKHSVKPSAPGTMPANLEVVITVDTFPMEEFRNARGLAMHRMLAQTLPKADERLVATIAEDLAGRMPHPSAVWKAIFRRWVEFHPQHAQNFARRVDLVDLEYEAALAWAKHDLEGAVEGFGRHLEPEWRGVLEVLARVDPARGVALLEPTEESPKIAIRGLDRFLPLLKAWAFREPAAALAYVQSKLSPYPDPLSSVIEGWIAQDPVACAAWIVSQEIRMTNGYAISLALRAAARDHPREVLTALTSARQSGRGIVGDSNIAQACAVGVPDAAWEFVRNWIPKGLPRDVALGQLAAAVAPEDPLKAVHIMDEMGWRDLSDKDRKVFPEEVLSSGKTEIPENPYRLPFSRNMVAVLKNLAPVDAALASRCFEKAVSVPSVEQLSLLQAFVPTWFQKAPDAALQWLSSWPSERIGQEELRKLILDLDLDAAAMAEWAQRLPSGPLQHALVRESVATGDPLAKLDHIPFSDAAMRQIALEEIIGNWGQSQPETALDHLLTCPNPMPEACQRILQAWTELDPKTASAWVARLPAGPNQDGCICGMVTTLKADIFNSTYPDALAWVLRMDSPAKRLEQARQLLAVWPKDEIEAAVMRASITTSTLPETEQQSLIQQLDP